MKRTDTQNTEEEDRIRYRELKHDAAAGVR